MADGTLSRVLGGEDRWRGATCLDPRFCCNATTFSDFKPKRVFWFCSNNRKRRLDLGSRSWFFDFHEIANCLLFWDRIWSNDIRKFDQSNIEFSHAGQKRFSRTKMSYRPQIGNFVFESALWRRKFECNRRFFVSRNWQERCRNTHHRNWKVRWRCYGFLKLRWLFRIGFLSESE